MRGSGKKRMQDGLPGLDELYYVPQIDSDALLKVRLVDEAV
jgi:hypothetical protein